MPDKEREKFFTNRFLEHYNALTGKQYVIDCSPEDRDDIAGTYDFLCKDKNSTGDSLAVEEKSLNKSTENVRDNVEIGEIIAEVNRILDEKGLSYNKEYFFYVEFKNAPEKKERSKYAEKVAKVVEEVIRQNKNADISNRVSFKVEGCDLIKKIDLLETHNGQKVHFLFAPDSNFSRDVQADVYTALCEILQNCNTKLNIPRQEGKKTILLITNLVSIFNSRHIYEAMRCMNGQLYKNIDEIFFVNKRSFKEGFDVDKIK